MIWLLKKLRMCVIYTKNCGIFCRSNWRLKGDFVLRGFCHPTKTESAQSFLPSRDGGSNIEKSAWKINVNHYAERKNNYRAVLVVNKRIVTKKLVELIKHALNFGKCYISQLSSPIASCRMRRYGSLISINLLGEKTDETFKDFKTHTFSHHTNT